MKAFRVFLLLLLSLLLPIRGGLAATMACGEGGHGPGGAAMAHGHPGWQPAGQPQAPDLHGQAADAQGGATLHDHSHHDHSHDDGPSASVGDACSVCASGCHAAALAGPSPALLQARVVAVVAFPALDVPVPGFLPDGLERPPRGC